MATGARVCQHPLQRQGQEGCDDLPAEQGTYAVVFRCPTRHATEVGRWGRLTLVRGYYVYVGSAFGPGGVRTRVARHCRRTKRRHWHIDYVSEHLIPLDAWYCNDQIHSEHRWADVLDHMAGMAGIPAFGCSDCTCRSHFFQSRLLPDLTLFRKQVNS